jgi:hypothetical protein
MVGRRRASPSSTAAEARVPRRRPGARTRWRGMGLAVALASTVVLAWPSEAEAAPSDDRPWGRGVLRPSFGLSPWGLLNPDVASLSFGLGFNYYIINGLSVGLGVSDTIFIYRSAFRAQYPGIETQLPTNMVEITPTLQYVFFRSRWFSPYVYGGVGPVFFNHGAGTHGQWVAGPGVYINVAGPLYVSLGVGFSGLFPGGRCNDALTYQPQDPLGQGLLLDLCSFRWGIQPGLVLAFGGGGRRQERRPPRQRQREPEPAINPLDEVVAPVPSEDVSPPTDSEDIEAPVDDPQANPAGAVEATPPEGDAPVDAPPEGTEPDVPVPAPAPGSTDVPLPPQTARIAPPR